MTAPDPRLDAIEARAKEATYSWAHELREDRDYLLALARKQQAEIKRYAEEDADAFMKLQVTESQAKLRATIRKQAAALDAALALAEEWRYKGEFGWGAWQEGHGPDPEGYALDGASADLRAAISDALGEA